MIEELKAELREMADAIANNRSDMIEKYQIEFVERGWERVTDAINSTRIVYFTDRGTVVKFPKLDTFQQCNETEVKNWEHVNDETMLAPVVDYGDEYQWLEMLRCGRISHSTMSRKNRFYQKVNEWKYELNDIHCQNLGWNPQNRELVAIDYASSEFWNQTSDNR